MFGSVMSRHRTVFVCAAAVVFAAPLSSSALALVGRLVAAYFFAALAARLLAPLLPRPMLPDIHARVILVTGCSSGFGHKIALALDKLGVSVLAACRNPQGEGVIELQKKASSKLRVVKMDVESDESVAAAVEEVRKILGENHLWAVVNNAGVLVMSEGLWLNEEDLRKALEVNTFGLVRVTRAFMPMLHEARGRVVNVLSISCRLTLAGLTPYIMTKRASLAFSDGLREEVRRFCVSVHTIEPHAYNTSMSVTRHDSMVRAWQNCPDEIKKLYGNNYLEKAKNSSNILAYFIYPERKVSIVADAVVDACLAQDPQDSCIPSYGGSALAALVNYYPWGTKHLNDTFLPKIEK